MRVTAAAVMVAVVVSYGFRTASPPANAEDSVVMTEIIQTVNWAGEKFNTGPISVTAGTLPDPNAFAMTMGRNIVVNSVYANDPLGLFAAIQSNVDAGWIPAGCTPAKTVALHEVAHVIDNVRGRLGSRRAAVTYLRGNALRGQVSNYSFGENGVFNAAEAVASAFQSVLCNGGTDAEMDMYFMLVQP